LGTSVRTATTSSASWNVFAWISCYRPLNTIFDWIKEHLVAFVEIAFDSILVRRLKRLEVDEVSAWRLSR
jgi:hypothetical protein